LLPGSHRSFRNHRNDELAPDHSRRIYGRLALFACALLALLFLGRFAAWLFGFARFLLLVVGAFGAGFGNVRL
jgi:hypothetical protein